MHILIGADIVPTATNSELFCEGNANELVGEELLQLLLSADYRIFNLEVPLTDTPNPIEKCGPALIAETATIKGYKSLGIDCVTLANNHIMDQGAEGLYSTFKTLRDNHIEYIGAGDNIENVRSSVELELAEKKIGIYVCAEHEFSIAGKNIPGANPFDALETFDHIRALKAACDYVIVLYHGGKEHYRYPSPNLQKTSRKMVDCGANLVLCQHSHCIGCEEKYQKGIIVYGQGNFLFDYNRSECWQTGLLVRVDVADEFSVSYIPLKKMDNCVRLASDEDAKEILRSFEKRSVEITSCDFVENNYEEFAESMSDFYIASFCGINTKNLVFRLLNKLSRQGYARWMLRRKCSKRTCLKLRNFIECESHRELVLKVLTEKFNLAEK